MVRIPLALTSLVLLAACATAPQVTPGVLSDLAPTGARDVGFLAIEPKRAHEIEFAPAGYLEIEKNGALGAKVAPPAAQ